MSKTIHRILGLSPFDVAHLLSSFLETTGIFWYNCKMGLALILVGYKVHIHLSSLCCQMKSDYMHFFEISWYFINVHNSAIKRGLVNIQIVIVSQQFYFQHSRIKITFFFPMKLQYAGRSCTGKNWLTKIGLRNNIHQKRKISCSILWYSRHISWNRN